MQNKKLNLVDFTLVNGKIDLNIPAQYNNLGQKHLSECMKALEYPPNIPGWCNGYSAMIGQSALSSEEDLITTMSRLELIYSTKPDQLRGAINSGNPLLAETAAFIEGIEVSQNPTNHPELFSADKQFTSQDHLLSFPLILNAKLEKKGITSPVNKICQVYSNEGLVDHFSRLEKIIDSSKKPFILTLNTGSHTVEAWYDFNRKNWIIADANLAPYLLRCDAQKLSSYMTTLYGNNNHIALSTNLYIAGESDNNFKTSLMQWRAQSEAQRITPEKAIFHRKGYSGLYLAASHGDERLLGQLLAELDKSPDLKKDFINLPTREGFTALYVAANKGYLNIVSLLLENGASAEISELRGYPFFVAAEFGHTEIIELFLNKGVDVNFIHPKDGFTALDLAAQNGQTAVVKFLLDKGAEIDLGHKNSGFSALQLAAQNGHTEVVKLLLDRGADVRLRNPADLSTALHAASQNGHAEVVKLLLDKKSNAAWANIHKIRPLKLAAMHGQLKVVETLLAHGSNKSQLDSKDVTNLLFKAIEQHNLTIFKEFLNKDSDSNLVNENGASLLNHAIKLDDKHIINHLKQMGISTPTASPPLAERQKPGITHDTSTADKKRPETPPKWSRKNEPAKNAEKTPLLLRWLSPKKLSPKVNETDKQTSTTQKKGNTC